MAGGDLGPAEAAEARGHVARCAACRQLFEALQGDQATYSRAADIGRSVGQVWAGAADMVDGVLDELARTQAPPSRPVRSERRTWASGRALVAAAMAFVVAAAVSVSWRVLTSQNPDAGGAGDVALVSPPAPRQALPPAPAVSSDPAVETFPALETPTGQAQGTPAETVIARSARSTVPAGDRRMFVRRNRSGDVELSWAGDDRESGAFRQPYTVLASAQPDFMRSEATQVHGRHHVASGALPTFRAPDRALTFFRVE